MCSGQKIAYLQNVDIGVKSDYLLIGYCFKSLFLRREVKFVDISLLRSENRCCIRSDFAQRVEFVFFAAST